MVIPRESRWSLKGWERGDFLLLLGITIFEVRLEDSGKTSTKATFVEFHNVMAPNSRECILEAEEDSVEARLVVSWHFKANSIQVDFLSKHS